MNLDFEMGTYYDEKPEMIGTPSSSWVSDDFGVITLCSDKPMNKVQGITGVSQKKFGWKFLEVREGEMVQPVELYTSNDKYVELERLYFCGTLDRTSIHQPVKLVFFTR